MAVRAFADQHSARIGPTAWRRSGRIVTAPRWSIRREHERGDRRGARTGTPTARHDSAYSLQPRRLRTHQPGSRTGSHEGVLAEHAHASDDSRSCRLRPVARQRPPSAERRSRPAAPIGSAGRIFPGLPDTHGRRRQPGVGPHIPEIDFQGTPAPRHAGTRPFGAPVATMGAPPGQQRPRALSYVADCLSDYFDCAVAPYWSRIRSRFEAERAKHARTLAAGDIGRLLSTLHPDIAWRPPVLTIMSLRVDRDVHLQGRGLCILPSFFCWRVPTVLKDPVCQVSWCTP